ncbi:hypothetical protein A6J53_14375 [Neisseria meningitidis]|nr:hypothetical protein A6J53_14375 [Neisseria meningitidis]MBG8583640.1 hypothetical protein [Neisseria meningitidis]
MLNRHSHESGNLERGVSVISDRFPPRQGVWIPACAGMTNPSARKPAPRHSYEPTSRHSHESGNPERKI